MKKLIIAAIVMISMGVQCFAGPIITVSIEFGHRDVNNICIQKGLCRVTLGGSRSITANINDQTGNLEMTFSKNSTQAAEFENQFANGLFDVPVAYILASDVCSKLGVGSFTVKAGKYKVLDTGDQYKIVFQK